MCGQIVDYEILPEFRAGNYYEGLDKATSTLMSLASGEFPADQYGKVKGRAISVRLAPFIFIIIFIIIMLFFRSSGGSNQKNISSKRITFMGAAVDDEFRKEQT